MIVRHQRESASNRGFRQLARYIQGRGAKPRTTWFHSANLPGVSGRDDLELACALVEAVQAQNTRAGSKRTYHLVISLHPDDRRLEARGAPTGCGQACGYSGVFRASVRRCASQRYGSRAHPRCHQQDSPRDLSHSLARVGPPEALHRGPGPREGARPDTASVEDARPRKDSRASHRLRSPPRHPQLRALGPRKSPARDTGGRATKVGRRTRSLRPFRGRDSAAWQRPRIRGCGERRSGEGLVRRSGAQQGAALRTAWSVPTRIGATAGSCAPGAPSVLTHAGPGTPELVEGVRADPPRSASSS